MQKYREIFMHACVCVCVWKKHINATEDAMTLESEFENIIRLGGLVLGSDTWVEISGEIYYHCLHNYDGM